MPRGHYVHKHSATHKAVRKVAVHKPHKAPKVHAVHAKKPVAQHEHTTVHHEKTTHGTVSHLKEHLDTGHVSTAGRGGRPTRGSRFH